MASGIFSLLGRVGNGKSAGGETMTGKASGNGFEEGWSEEPPYFGNIYYYY